LSFEALKFDRYLKTLRTKYLTPSSGYKTGADGGFGEVGGVGTQTTRRHMAEDSDFYSHCRVSLSSHRYIDVSSKIHACCHRRSYRMSVIDWICHDVAIVLM